MFLISIIKAIQLLGNFCECNFKNKIPAKYYIIYQKSQYYTIYFFINNIFPSWQIISIIHAWEGVCEKKWNTIIFGIWKHEISKLKSISY